MRANSLFLSIAAWGVFAPAVVCTAQSTPTAADVIERHAAASGGVDALNKHTSIRLTGKVEFSGTDLSGTIEILRGRGNKFVKKMVLNNLGTIVKGYDSTVAWSIDPSGPALLTGPDADATQVEANWYHAFLAPPEMRGARVDSSEFAGEPAWKLTYASELGLEVFAYFSRATGLRMGETRVAPVGETSSTETDYKDFGGLKIPMTVTNRSRAGAMVITIESVEFDKTPAAALALPPQVRALIKPR